MRLLYVVICIAANLISNPYTRIVMLLMVQVKHLINCLGYTINCEFVLIFISVKMDEMKLLKPEVKHWVTALITAFC